MIRLTVYFNHWLMKHGIAVDGVKIILEFGNISDMCRAEAAIKHELTPLVQYQTDKIPDGIATLNGINLALRTRS